MDKFNLNVKNFSFQMNWYGIENTIQVEISTTQVFRCIRVLVEKRRVEGSATWDRHNRGGGPFINKNLLNVLTHNENLNKKIKLRWQARKMVFQIKSNRIGISRINSSYGRYQSLLSWWTHMNELQHRLHWRCLG